MSKAKEELIKKLNEYKSNFNFAEILMFDAVKKNSNIDTTFDNMSEEEKEKIAEMALQLIEEFEKLQKD
ncbi:hypothetical protein HYG86_10165 [Alkalicella caledoniensis]|uniref:Uncharacterized protein n=1 Tax=Alkalicella caledoniensis TaxID=2731377 RepID=A0A7G9W8T7_ALKCA|nr:hypothetical protein [Alkalicella caledoniensis]QNO15099.1 hypothetical protein HYG86_10165 [Alkalicella caledoniensis]